MKIFVPSVTAVANSSACGSAAIGVQVVPSNLYEDAITAPLDTPAKLYRLAPTPTTAPSKTGTG